MKILRLRMKWPPTPKQMISSIAKVYDKVFWCMIGSITSYSFQKKILPISISSDKIWNSYINKNLISKHKFSAIFVFISRPSDSCQKNFVWKRKYQSCNENINYHCITTKIYENMNILCVICSILLLNILHDFVDGYVYGY